jgi:hypothetical protein
VRVFDLRDKEHSTIIYESPRQGTPLLRLGWNKQDPRYMATIMQVGACLQHGARASNPQRLYGEAVVIEGSVLGLAAWSRVTNSDGRGEQRGEVGEGEG